MSGVPIWKVFQVFWQGLTKPQRYGLYAGTGLALFSLLVIAVRADNWADWTGLGGGEATTIDIQKDKNGNIVAITTSEPGRTLWDWLGLLGVPLTLAVLGYVIQRQEQKRVAEEEKEEILQTYIDRVSTALVDKNILAIAQKDTTIIYTSEKDVKPTLEEKELLHAAIDVIRARTLSILRRLENDPERKRSVILFLIEAEVISKGKLPLSDVNLNGANLCFAKLNGADLSKANLNGATLWNADLSSFNLFGADRQGIKWNERTQWPAPEEVAKARNIPEALKQQLGIE